MLSVVVLSIIIKTFTILSDLVVAHASDFLL